MSKPASRSQGGQQPAERPAQAVFSHSPGCVGFGRGGFQKWDGTAGNVDWNGGETIPKKEKKKTQNALSYFYKRNDMTKGEPGEREIVPKGR
jgi:hypothetical protein